VRIRTATSEIQQVENFDYLVINDSFEEALSELQSILVAESCKGRYRIPPRKERWAREIDDYRVGSLPQSPPLPSKAKSKK
jgi:hypothetical protein